MSKPIRALLLAAGLGTRLRPITINTPKCLVPIGEKPLLEHWLNKLEYCGCNDALINTHHLAYQVKAFLKNRPTSGLKINYTHEQELLGTAGTLVANQKFFVNSTGLLIHADNATHFQLNELLHTHKKRPKGCLMTMLTFKTDSPHSCGIVEIDEQGIVTGFHEKSENPPSNRANGAIYAFDSDFIDFINTIDKGASDFSTQIIPKLVGKIATHHTLEKFIDIGTPESLRKAQLTWNQAD